MFCAVICSKGTNSGSINKVGTSNLLFQSKINGMNEAISRTLDYFDDEYGGVIVNPDKLPSNPNVFASMLQSSLSRWTIKVIYFPFCDDYWFLLFCPE